MNLIDLVTTTSNDVAVGGVVPLTTISRRAGCNIQYGVNGAVLKRAGYYLVTGTVTFEGTTTGANTLTVYKNGVPIVGTGVSSSTADATVYTLPINAIVRQYCNEPDSLITIVNSGVAITVTNANLSVVAL